MSQHLVIGICDSENLVLGFSNSVNIASKNMQKTSWEFVQTFVSLKNFPTKNYALKAGLKKLFVCRHTTDPTLEVPTPNILLNL